MKEYLQLFKQEDVWLWHFYQGLYNNYPLCCVIFFCNGWLNNANQGGGIYDKIIYKEEINWTSGNHIKCLECVISTVKSK